MDAMLQKFWFKNDTPPTRVNEVSMYSIHQQISELTSLVHQLAAGNAQQGEVYGSYSVRGYPNDIFPTFQGGGVEYEYPVGYFPDSSMQYDPYSDMCDYNWRDHSNFYYGGNTPTGFEQDYQQNWQQQQSFPIEPPHPQNSSSSLEEIVKSLALTQQ